MSSRRIAASVVVALAALCCACQDRPVNMIVHTPAQCCRPEVIGGECEEDPCPLRDLASVYIALERVDGSVEAERCSSPPSGACTYEDLEGFTFIEDIQPVDGVEVLMMGYAEPDCRGTLYFRCDSFGENIVDLQSEDYDLRVWCSCAPLDR